MTSVHPPDRGRGALGELRPHARRATDLDLVVPRGSVYALLGRNGAGKSSLLRVLLGERPPAAGRVRLLGEDPWARRAALMERVGVVPEQPDAPPEMTAAQLSASAHGSTAAGTMRLVLERLARFEVPAGPPVRRAVEGPEGRRHARARPRPLPGAAAARRPHARPRRGRARRRLPRGDRRAGRPRYDRLRHHATTCARSRASPIAWPSSTTGGSPSREAWRPSRPSGADRSRRSSPR